MMTPHGAAQGLSDAYIRRNSENYYTDIKSWHCRSAHCPLQVVIVEWSGSPFAA